MIKKKQVALWSFKIFGVISREDFTVKLRSLNMAHNISFSMYNVLFHHLITLTVKMIVPKLDHCDIVPNTRTVVALEVFLKLVFNLRDLLKRVRHTSLPFLIDLVDRFRSELRPELITHLMSNKIEKVVKTAL
jgi:hypothetical protein